MRVIVCLLWMLWVRPVFGCGVCVNLSGSGLTLPHPRAIEIAVATRNASLTGLLPRSESSSWNRTDDVFSEFAAKINPLRPIEGLPATLHVVLVDTGESFAIHCRGGRFVVERTAGFRDADGGVATTSLTLRALLAGAVAFDEAVTRNLVVVDPPNRVRFANLFAKK